MGRKAKVQVLLAALISGPLSAQTYDPTLITPQIIGTPQTMTPLSLGDDNTRSINLGFSFQYFGQTYTSAWVSSNGFVSFNGPDDLCCNGYSMSQAPRNTIYAYWTDLISGPNPYYRLSQDGALFGWYGTNEYGTSNKNTFEIELYANGNIQINYGAVANTYHYVSAGLTGPTSSDNVQLFYGRDVSGLNYQSGLFSLVKPAEIPTPVVVAPTPAPTVAPNPVTQTASTPQTTTMTALQTQVQAVEAVTQSVAPSPAETVQATQAVASDPVVAASPAPTETERTATTATVATTTTQEASVASQEAAPPPPGGIPGMPVIMVAGMRVQAQETTQAATVEAKRDTAKEKLYSGAVESADALKSDTVIVVRTQDVGTLADYDAQYNQKFGEQKTTDTFDVTYSLDPVSGPTFGPTITTNINDTFSSSGQAQQLNVLNMTNMQTEMASGTPTDIGDVNASDQEAMLQLAAVPAGYGSYTQARIPDMPFYRPRDIYENKRIPDANLALYRLLVSQDRKWRDMTEEQYGR